MSWTLWLAEISDKMPGIPALWFFMAVPTLLLCLCGFSIKSAAIVCLLGILFSIWMFLAQWDEIYVEPIGELIHDELGQSWIVNALLSTCLPAIAVVSLLIYRMYQRSQQLTLEHSEDA